MYGIILHMTALAGDSGPYVPPEHPGWLMVVVAILAGTALWLMAKGAK